MWYQQIRMVHWALAVHEAQRAPIIALSNAVTFMASQGDAQQYLKYWKFHFNCCSGSWVKQKKKEFKWPNLNQSVCGLGITFTLDKHELFSIEQQHGNIWASISSFFQNPVFHQCNGVNQTKKVCNNKCGHFQFFKNYSIIFFLNRKELHTLRVHTALWGVLGCLCRHIWAGLN